VAKAVKNRGRASSKRRSGQQPIEYSLLITATMCLLAFGAVMVFSASSARTLLSGEGDGTVYLVRYIIFAALGLVAMQLIAKSGLRALWRLTPLAVAVSFGLLLIVLTPAGLEINGAKRWLGAGILQFQPSEIAKLSLILYAARLIATDPLRVKTVKGMISPLLVIVALGCLLIAAEPDLGTTLVVVASIGAVLVAANVPLKNLGMIAAPMAGLVTIYALIEPYRRARLTAFMNPWDHLEGIGFQSVQGQIALGSGGIFGNGLGESVQKIFYLPEAHTDFILAVVGEELGVAGILLLIVLYGLFIYAGMRAATAAVSLYGKLVVVGVTSLIACQALLNMFAVMGMAPLTGVPLPFVSYGGTSLITVLAGVGLILNVANGGAGHLELVSDRRRSQSRGASQTAAAKRRASNRGQRSVGRR